MTPITFTVYGRPQQRGSKTPWIPRRKDGSLVTRASGAPAIVMMDSNKRSGDWMAQVRQAAGDVMAGRELLRGPLRLTAAFYFKRPQSHYGSGGNANVVKRTAPLFHTQTPDLDKLVRCLGDALTGIIWADDRQVCEYGEIIRAWTAEQERAVVSIREVEAA